MTKVEFIDKVAQETEWTKKDSEVAVNAVIKTITDALVAGEKLSFVGFGTFEIVERAAREGRNPQTGESMLIKASKTVKFKLAKAFKDLINGK